MAKAAKPQSFEAAQAELEALIADIERGELTLEASLAAYQRGGELLKFCQAQLDAAEQQIKMLDGAELAPLQRDEG